MIKANKMEIKEDKNQNQNNSKKRKNIEQKKPEKDLKKSQRRWK